MDSATEELYFQKLQEFVQDEDKIVTIASFASSVGISIQDSHKLIRKYVEDHRKLSSNDLAVTYVLTGLLKGGRERGVFMVKEEDLKAKLLLFENEPCKLIYSVQKTKYVDLNIIALVDMFDSTNIRDKALKGSIVSKNCTKRVLKVKKPAVPPPPTLKSKSSIFEPKPGKSNEITKSAEKQLESTKSEQKSKASGSIANLFKAATAKSNQQNGEKGSESNSVISKQMGKRKSGGLTGFLTNGTKQSSKANSAEAKENFQVEKKKRSNEDESRDDNIMEEKIIEVIDDDLEEEKDKEKNVKNEKVAKKMSNERKKQNKKRQRDKSEEMPSKKRKRIVERNDSDSDDMFERDDIIEKSDDEPERSPSPVTQKPLPPKNKRRKAVAKTYTDEEGFVVTKTEYICETASEDENEAPAPAPPKQEKLQHKQEKPKSKVIDKKKPTKNQSTLMNFFKKV